MFIQSRVVFCLPVWGFLGFNGGAVLALGGVANAVTMSLAVVNTILAASGGGMAALLLHIIQKRKHWSMMQVCNGVIAGMVSICAGANTVYPWAAWMIGLIGGFVYVSTPFICWRCRHL